MAAPILGIWQRSDKDAKDASLELAVERLEAQARVYLTEAKQGVIDARANLVSAQAASAGRPDFSAIVNAQLALKKAELVLAQATEVFTSTFGS